MNVFVLSKLTEKDMLKKLIFIAYDLVTLPLTKKEILFDKLNT